MYKIAKQSYESLHNLNPCLLLPNKSFQIRFTKIRSDTNMGENKQDNKKVCNVIYSNEAFNKDCNKDINSSGVKKHNLQAVVQHVEESDTVRRGISKRLSKRPLSRNDLNMTQKKSKTIKRMTRSGKVYSCFE